MCDSKEKMKKLIVSTIKILEQEIEMNDSIYNFFKSISNDNEVVNMTPHIFQYVDSVIEFTAPCEKESEWKELIYWYVYDIQDKDDAKIFIKDETGKEKTIVVDSKEKLADYLIGNLM